MMTERKNVLGYELELCSCSPMTGFFRDGICRTDQNDLGSHTVCAVMTEEFLSYSKAMGNDLSTESPEFNFPGLKAGDHWCICAPKWLEAYIDGMAPYVILESCDEQCLRYIRLEDLKSKEYTKDKS